MNNPTPAEMMKAAACLHSPTGQHSFGNMNKCIYCGGTQPRYFKDADVVAKPAADTCTHSPTKDHSRNSRGVCIYCATDRDGNKWDTSTPHKEVKIDSTATRSAIGIERSMAATVQAFNIITRRVGDRALTESEGWLLMQTLKDVRDRSTKAPHRDSLEDGIAYSSLKAEARLKE